MIKILIVLGAIISTVLTDFAHAEKIAEYDKKILGFVQSGRTHQKLSNEPRYRSPFIGDLTRGTF